MSRLDGIVAASIVASIYGCGFLTAWMIYGRPDVVVEQYAPSSVQGDGSVVLEKKPLQPGVKPKPPHDVPHGTKPTAGVSVTIEPAGGPVAKPGTESKECKTAADFSCPPVTVDLTLVREKDGQSRVIASSPDGRVVAGLHVPFENVVQPAHHPWTVSAAYTSEGEWGAQVQRDVGPAVVGAIVTPDMQAATLGLRF